MPTILISDSATEWIELAAAKLHCKIDAGLTADDAKVTQLITGVRHLAEAQTRRALIDNTYELVQDGFTSGLELIWTPVIEVVSVKYLDEAGVEQTLDPQDYQVDTVREPGWVVPAPDAAWPVTERGRVNTVRVRYRAGYGSAAAVPADLRLWMLAYLGHYYQHRGAASAGGLQPVPYLDRLLDGSRSWGF